MERGWWSRRVIIKIGWMLFNFVLASKLLPVKVKGLSKEEQFGGNFRKCRTSRDYDQVI